MSTRDKIISNLTSRVPFVVSYIPSVILSQEEDSTYSLSGEEEIKHIIFYFKSNRQYDIYLDNDLIGAITDTYDYFKIYYESKMLSEETKNILNTYENIEEDIKNIFDAYVEKIIRNNSVVKIGFPVELGTDHMREDYMHLLAQGCTMMAVKTHKGIEYAQYQYEKIEKWLRHGDFFTSPASTRFHDSEEGGLLYHTLKVYNYMVDLKRTSTFKNVDVGEMTICALTHDWCKIRLYEKYMKNVKDENTGTWYQKEVYKRVESKFPFGHGETSMYLATKFFHNLSLEGALAIRWHMDKYYTDDALNDDLLEAKVKYPLVVMLQTADKLSLVEY